LWKPRKWGLGVYGTTISGMDQLLITVTLPAAEATNPVPSAYREFTAT
jgi:hypothetical protein